MDRELERLKEQIKYRTELLKLAGLFTLALGGSSAGLLLGQLTLFRVCGHSRDSRDCSCPRIWLEAARPDPRTDSANRREP